MSDKDFFDRFEISDAQPIAEGFYGKVYSGIDKEKGDGVAIKVTKGIQMAWNESEIMAAYGAHPNLPEFRGYGEKNGVAHIAMELINGDPLGEYLSVQSRSRDYVLNIVDSLLGGLQAIHDSGSLHLDIYPRNILVRNSGMKNGVLIDFGCAERMDSDGFYEGKIKSENFEYSSPEQQVGEVAVNFTADFYSVAAIGAYLLSGKAPFAPNAEKFGTPADDSSEYIAEALRLKDDPRSSSGLGDGDLESVLLKGLSFNVNRRFGSALEFREALKSIKLN